MDLTKFASPIWFLQVLFCVEVLFTIIKKIASVHCTLIIVCIGTLGAFYSNSFEFMLPLALEPISAGLVFFYIGNKLKECKNIRLEENHYWLLIPMISVWVYLVSLNGCVDMRSARYFNPVLYFVNGVFGTLIFWNISRLVMVYLPIISRVIKYFSINSITYLCTHYIFVYYGGGLLSKYLPFPYVVIRSILIVSVLITCWVINIFIMKYFPWLIGKTNDIPKLR